MRADAVYFEGIRTTITAARTPTIIGRPRMRRLLLARTIRRSTRLSSSSSKNSVFACVKWSLLLRRLLGQDADGRGAQAELVEDLGDVLEVLHVGDLLRELRDDDLVAGQRRVALEAAHGEEAARVGLGHAAQVRHVEACRVTVDAGAAREVEVVGELGTSFEQEAVGRDHLADHRHRGRHARDPDRVAVLEDGAGQVALGGVLGEGQDHAAGGLDLLQLLEVVRLHLGVCPGGGRVLRGQAGLGDVAVVQGELRLGLLDGCVHGPLLVGPQALAVELGPEEVGVTGHAAHACHQLAQGLALLDLVEAAVLELALEADVDAAALDGDGDVVLGEDGDDVTRLEDEVVLGIALDDGLRQVERQEGIGQGLAVEALDDGVVPVDLGQGALEGGPLLACVLALAVVAPGLYLAVFLVVEVLELAVVGVREQGDVLA